MWTGSEISGPAKKKVTLKNNNDENRKISLIQKAATLKATGSQKKKMTAINKRTFSCKYLGPLNTSGTNHKARYFRRNFN